MNFMNFLLTRQLVVNRTGDTNRANQLGMLTSFMPGPWGMMMGVVLANREQAPTSKDDGGGKVDGGAAGGVGGAGGGVDGTAPGGGAATAAAGGKGGVAAQAGKERAP
jgi:hypothetical protein